MLAQDRLAHLTAVEGSTALGNEVLGTQGWGRVGELDDGDVQAAVSAGEWTRQVRLALIDAPADRGGRWMSWLHRQASTATTHILEGVGPQPTV